jgi:hypothetical protein
MKLSEGRVRDNEENSNFSSNDLVARLNSPPHYHQHDDDDG